MDIKLDVNEKTVGGISIIEYVNNSPDILNNIYMHLYPNAFQVGSVKYREFKQKYGRLPRAAQFLKGYEDSFSKIDVHRFQIVSNGAVLSDTFKIDDTILSAELINGLKPGESITIELDWTHHGESPLATIISNGLPVHCGSPGDGGYGNTLMVRPDSKIGTLDDLIERRAIELAPLAFMRGRSLNESFIILDEAQNTTIEQMKMFLTRMGYGSKSVVNGDSTQIDLPTDKVSGLKHAVEVLNGIEGIGVINFSHSDVVRHKIVQNIVEAYEKHQR